MSMSRVSGNVEVTRISCPRLIKHPFRFGWYWLFLDLTQCQGDEEDSAAQYHSEKEKKGGDGSEPRGKNVSIPIGELFSFSMQQVLLGSVWRCHYQRLHGHQVTQHTDFVTVKLLNALQSNIYGMIAVRFRTLFPGLTGQGWMLESWQIKSDRESHSQKGHADRTEENV